MSRKSLLVLPAVLLMGLAVAASPQALANEVQIITGFGEIPESMVIAPDGKIYVTVVNSWDQLGDGYVGVVEGNSVVPLATGLNDPHGLDYWNGNLYVADNGGQIWRVGLDGTVTLIAEKAQFPGKQTINFNDIELDADGNIYVSDSGDWEGRGGAIYRVTQGGAITTVLSDEDAWQLMSPNGLLLEGSDTMLVLDWTLGNLHRLDLNTGSFEKVNGGFGDDNGGPFNGDGLAWDPQGRLYVSAYYDGIYVLDTPESEPSEVMSLEGLGLDSAADIFVSSDGKVLVVPDFDGGRIAIVTLD